MRISTLLASSAIAEVVSDVDTDSETHTKTSLPAFFLEISRGRTRFPRRPILEDRFLIGADPECDLCLGGAEMPPLHCILKVENGEVWLDAAAGSPALLVNGQVVQTARLKNGDMIEIGLFEFRFGQTDATSNNVPFQFDSPAAPVAVDEFKDEDVQEDGWLEGLTASELIELIEEEEDFVRRFEARQQMGAAALMQAARDQFTPASDAAPSEQLAREETVHQNDVSTEHAELELLHDLDRIVQQLNEVSQELQDRSQRLSRREESYAGAAEQMLDAQQQLADQLEVLVARLPDRVFEPIRAIA